METFEKINERVYLDKRVSGILDGPECRYTTEWTFKYKNSEGKKRVEMQFYECPMHSQGDNIFLRKYISKIQVFWYIHLKKKPPTIQFWHPSCYVSNAIDYTSLILRFFLVSGLLLLIHFYKTIDILIGKKMKVIVLLQK